MRLTLNIKTKGNRQFLVTVFISLITVCIGLTQIFNYHISPIVLGYFLILSPASIMGLYFLANVYYKRKYMILTKITKLNQETIMSELNVDKITGRDIACLNRFNIEYSAGTLFWPSSWIGASTNNKVDNVIVEDDREQNDYKGKIPVDVFSVESKKRYGIRLKFQHNKGEWWTAVLHGKFGKPSQQIWSRNTLNLDVVKTISFLGKSNKEKLEIYIRFEDIRNNSSNGVIIEIKDSWKIYEIPISKFLKSRELAYDVNFYLMDIIKKNTSDFDTTQVQQIDFGCSDPMHTQEGEILLCDMKFN